MNLSNVVSTNPVQNRLFIHNSYESFVGTRQDLEASRLILQTSNNTLLSTLINKPVCRNWFTSPIPKYIQNNFSKNYPPRTKTST